MKEAVITLLKMAAICALCIGIIYAIVLLAQRLAAG